MMFSASERLIEVTPDGSVIVLTIPAELQIYLNTVGIKEDDWAWGGGWRWVAQRRIEPWPLLTMWWLLTVEEDKAEDEEEVTETLMPVSR